MARHTTSTQKISTTKHSTSKPKVCFAGIDYHKKFSVVTLGDKDGNAVSTTRLANIKEEIRAFFEQYPSVVCVVESCRGYEWFLDFLKEDLGLTVHLSNPYKTKLITETRCKTDKVDSKQLMELLAINYIPTCYQPTPNERRLRERLRWRATLVRQTTGMKVRIHSLLDKENLGITEDLFSINGREYLDRVPLSESRRLLINDQFKLLQVLENMVKQEDRSVNIEVKRSPEAKLLVSIPGIGPLTALLLVAEIGDITRFRNSSRLAAYFGMVPSVISSGGKFRFGGLTKQGSAHVRWMLNQASWCALKKSEALEFHYRSVAARKGKHAAISSVARKLIKIVYRVLKDKKPFKTQLVGKKAC